MAKAKKPQELEVIKRPHQGAVSMTERQVLELMDCEEDPLYFMRTFMKVQHPIKGAIPFEPYPFQIRIIDAFHKNRFVTCLTARQMGKCSTSNINILADGSQQKIGSLVKVSFKERVVNWLEKILLQLAIKK